MTADILVTSQTCWLFFRTVSPLVQHAKFVTLLVCKMVGGLSALKFYVYALVIVQSWNAKMC